MANLKPSKPAVYDDKRDALTVDELIYQVDTYQNLLALSNPALNLTEEIKVQDASTLLKNNATNWYCMQVQAGNTPAT